MLASYGQVDAAHDGGRRVGRDGKAAIPPVEILKVAHHGSGRSRACRASSLGSDPRIAVDLGRRGQRLRASGPGTVAALESAPGLALYRTDRDGRVVVESDGRRISVRTRTADYAWPRCPASRCYRSTSSRAATGRSISARSAGFVRASAPRRVEQLSAEDVSGADAVAACNALGLFGATAAAGS